jgi:hypothetical protein
MPNDVVRLAALQAADDFGGHDGTFNAAGFGQALCRIAGVDSSLDGRIVRALLFGRTDIEPLHGAHYRALPAPVPQNVDLTEGIPPMEVARTDEGVVARRKK